MAEAYAFKKDRMEIATEIRNRYFQRDNEMTKLENIKVGRHYIYRPRIVKFQERIVSRDSKMSEFQTKLEEMKVMPPTLELRLPIVNGK